MDGPDAPPGAMCLVVPGNVRALHPVAAMLDAMLTGWTRQQQSRLLGKTTITDQVSVVRRFARFKDVSVAVDRGGTLTGQTAAAP
ncbi:hypothetical protein AB0K23_37395 [Streptomyces sp. NPDC049602]|uniref:hypothetical protein n=1 Tax=Streptomyces sp. NPDC049602 TaxID=3155504 RepID=UPI003414A13C